MARILITSGPTRQYLDPIRYLTNASSGRTGAALAHSALELGFEVVIVSGPVEIKYPQGAEVIPIISTEEMLARSLEVFSDCDGVIGVAAPCDYRPLKVAENKLSKSDFTRTKESNGTLLLKLVETPDIMATLAAHRRIPVEGHQRQWMVAFALETMDHRCRALQKLQRKSCDLIVLNDQKAINGVGTSMEVLDRDGNTIAQLSGLKTKVAFELMNIIKNYTWR